MYQGFSLMFLFVYLKMVEINIIFQLLAGSFWRKGLFFDALEIKY
jgi:hypothetical protein